MCIAILQPPNQRTPKRNLEIGFRNNPDGAGFAYAYKNKLILEKGFFELDSFLKAVKQIPKDATAIVHCRKKTHGPKNKENCHPFLIDNNHALIHNGVIKQHDKGKEISDTKHFVDKMLKPMFEKDPKLWRKDWVKELLEHYINYGNKCVILSNTGKYLILREVYGEWHEGCWYSNNSFRYFSAAYWNDYYYNTSSANFSPVKKNSLSVDSDTTQTMSRFVEIKDIDKVDEMLDRLDNSEKTATDIITAPQLAKLNDYANKLVEKVYGKSK